MRLLYNWRLSGALEARQARKIGFVLISMSLIGGSISCRRATTSSDPTPAGRPPAEAIATADQLYQGRPDLAKVREAIVALRQSQADAPTNYDLAWRLAKYNYYLGAHSPDSTEQDKAFHDGIDAGKLAVQLQPGKPDGHFWLGANYGGSAQISTLAGWAQINDIKDQMEAVLKINEGFQEGSAYMVLGQLYLQSPRILGGDVEKSINYLEKGIKFGPDNSLMRLHLAEAYAADHKNSAAQKEIDTLMSMKAAPGFEPEHQEALSEAQELQAKLKNN